MKSYRLTLRILALGIFGVSLIHIFLGVSSEVLLGSGISHPSLLDPNLDSQNRFYGAAFSLYGAVFWLCSRDITQFQHFLVMAFALFFLAGVARLISIALVGWPSLPILGLGAIEILGPPIMYHWLRQVLKS